MKQVSRTISTYTADVSGVCSALFELGGMCIMHDPSGCNSTYNTHDEPRWYDFDSQIYITGLSEMEAIMGDDEKIISDIVEAANELKPNFIAIAGTPIPMMIGTDFKAIASIVEKKTGIKTFGVETNGMHSYINGSSMAFKKLIEKFCTKDYKCTDDNRVNIIGLTPLDFSVNSSVDSLKSKLESSGFTINSSVAMGCDFESIKNLSNASCNLVVSHNGLEAAKELERRFGTPYLIGVPYFQKYGENVIESLHKTIKSKTSGTAFSNRIPQESVVIIGESVNALSLSNAYFEEFGICPRVICPVETDATLINGIDKNLPFEADIRQSLITAKTVIADPLFKTICPKNAEFVPLPHEAFSGRIYRNQIPDLISNSKYFN